MPHVKDASAVNSGITPLTYGQCNFPSGCNALYGNTGEERVSFERGAGNAVLATLLAPAE